MKGLADIEGLRVGHMSDFDGVTHCAVVLCPPEGAVAGVGVRGVQQARSLGGAPCRQDFNRS